MPDLPMLNSVVELLLGLLGLAAAAAGWLRWGWPRYKQHREEKASLHELWHGRPAVPANLLTGAKAEPAKPSIGQLVAEIWHELHPNGGSSLKDSQTRTEETLKGVVTRLDTIEQRLAAGDRRFDHIDEVLAEELHTANDAVANAAEAAKTLLPVIDTAIKAKPPAQE